VNAPDLEKLTKRYGERNVENVMILINRQTHPRTDLRVHIPTSIKRVKKILKAIHGDYES